MNTTPKYTTSMPAALTAGSRTGVNIIIVGVTSIDVPTSRTIPAITNIRRVGWAINGARIPVTIDGIFPTVISQEDTMAAAARNIITEEDLAADTKQSISMDNFSSLYTNSPIIRAYTAVMTPASVGVNLPLLNPTKMNTGRSRARIRLSGILLPASGSAWELLAVYPS